MLKYNGARARKIVSRAAASRGSSFSLARGTEFHYVMWQTPHYAIETFGEKRREARGTAISSYIVASCFRARARSIYRRGRSECIALSAYQTAGRAIDGNGF